MLFIYDALAWLGALTECASLAIEAAYDAGLDSATRVLAGRVLLATAGEDAKRRYAEFIIAERSALPVDMVRDALTEFFPALMEVDDLLGLVVEGDPKCVGPHDVEISNLENWMSHGSIQRFNRSRSLAVLQELPVSNKFVLVQFRPCLYEA